MKEWWQSLTLRERQLVIVCGILCGIAFLYWVIWAPVQAGFDLTRKQVAGLEWQRGGRISVRRVRGPHLWRGMGAGPRLRPFEPRCGNPFRVVTRGDRPGLRRIR